MTAGQQRGREERVLACGTTLSLGDDGIVRVLPAQGMTEDLDTTTEMLAAGRELLAGRRVPLLYDSRPLRAITVAAQRELVKRSGELISALALVMSSPIHRAAAKVFLRALRTPVPTRVFSGEAEALAWLRARAG